MGNVAGNVLQIVRPRPADHDCIVCCSQREDTGIKLSSRTRDPSESFRAQPAILYYRVKRRRRSAGSIPHPHISARMLILPKRSSQNVRHRAQQFAEELKTFAENVKTSAQKLKTKPGKGFRTEGGGGLTGCGKTHRKRQEVSGHDFSRADTSRIKPTKSAPALAAERRLSARSKQERDLQTLRSP